MSRMTGCLDLFAVPLFFVPGIQNRQFALQCPGHYLWAGLRQPPKLRKSTPGAVQSPWAKGVALAPVCALRYTQMHSWARFSLWECRWRR